ncbi:BZ3500_MvSof-1268-A1-R1_Chr3-1g05490 [Microbotryum saponariae]|uniref:BZ3500_MvSof-1268-A1-R1_Chr3-1g05490 protein n=1 Tax=Microbotryum saponariae TaxID=289078 RepID=A0A2X0KWH2_9BASI|nr:BZ3500_MvSof-1268-A1-R1_Chr3-1g05490 [Microbotryum saponariae]SDA04681.1 BZ3501_MvSof-1269-A2-R1_Chr3-1g05161 [Microbotryum saponariae]
MSPSVEGLNLHPYLLLPGDSKRLATLLESLIRSSSSSAPPSTSTSPTETTTTTTTTTTSSSPSLTPSPELKLYSDILYANHHSLGLSLSYKPNSKTSKLPKVIDEINWAKLKLVGVDVYNPETWKGQESKGTENKKKLEYRPFPRYPIVISVPASAVADAPTSTTTKNTTTATSDPSSPTTVLVHPTTQAHDFTSSLGEPDRKGGGAGSMGIWCEWTQLGVMVEFASAGLEAWDKGRDVRWMVLSLFERGDEVVVEGAEAKDR